ncbi:E3 ubiquitin/ISG15 ligase TRIM25-like [Lissotriton helveticus]
MSGSLLDLSEEFTCSICLGTFESPVTTPCGHNFCRVCLEVIWATEAQEGWKCPQCRTGFATKPELRKNTVLDTVVQQYLLDVNRCEQEQQAQPEPEEEEESCPDGAVPCDSCLKVAAVRTCVTSIASFCQEHLQPHLGSQAFAHHQLHSPLGSSELGLRTCKDHKKLLEYFCEEHGKCLCCYCLVDQKACKTHTVPEAKLKRENQESPVKVLRPEATRKIMSLPQGSLNNMAVFEGMPLDALCAPPVHTAEEYHDNTSGESGNPPQVLDAGRVHGVGASWRPRAQNVLAMKPASIQHIRHPSFFHFSTW